MTQPNKVYTINMYNVNRDQAICVAQVMRLHYRDAVSHATVTAEYIIPMETPTDRQYERSYLITLYSQHRRLSPAPMIGCLARHRNTFPDSTFTIN